ncbi:MAG: HepT-like ribonuclease domain-containing protein [Syntrophales bacterium]
MTRHDVLVRVRHMLDNAREALNMTVGLCHEDLDKNRQLNLALVRLLEILGEAAARVDDDFRQQHVDIPWRDIADLRNRLIHGYDTVNFDILWAILREDLPPLIARLEDILKGK